MQTYRHLCVLVRILNRILPTNKYLLVCKLSNCSLCDFAIQKMKLWNRTEQNPGMRETNTKSSTVKTREGGKPIQNPPK